MENIHQLLYYYSLVTIFNIKMWIHIGQFLMDISSNEKISEFARQFKKNNTVVMEYPTKYVSFIQSGSLSKCDV